MSEEDEFGELYSDLAAPESTTLQGTGLPGIGPAHKLYEDDGAEEEISSAGPAQLEKELVRKPPNGFMLGDEFSDEEQGLTTGGETEGDRLRDSLATESELGRTENRSLNSPHLEDGSRIVGMLKQAQESLEGEGSDKVAINGALELGNAGTPLVQDVRATLDTSLPSTFTSSQVPEKSPGAEDLTNQAVAIAGLSTSSNVVQVATVVEKHEGSEGKDAVGQGAGRERIQNFEDEDFESDSEDDLHIVLNDGHPFYQNFERRTDAGVEEGSEDEDGQDFVLLAGNEAVDEQEWGEELSLPPDGFQSEKSLHPGGGKHGVQGEERVQSGKGALHQGVSRSVYSGHTYHYNHHQYRYVRPGALGGGVASSGAQGLSNRVSQSKAGNGRGDWSGAGRGFPSSQKIPVAPWGNTGTRGLQYGFEYNLPPNKTVFEIDLDSLDEKPWRHPSVDISDYFNFGFNESSWKDYCKQLAQLHLESTMQSKIRVYESGRLEQEFDSGLPPELVAAAGTCGVSAEAAQGQLGTMIVTGPGGGGGRGAGREHMQGISTGRAIQVEGGLGERRPSADVRRQRIRDSDAIIVIDATVNALIKEQCEINDFRVDCTKDSTDIQFKRQLNVRGKAGSALQSRASALKKERLASGSNLQECGIRSRSVLAGDKAAAGSDIEIAQLNTCLEFKEPFSPPSVSRHKTPRPSTPPGRTPVQEKRESGREQSHSSSVHDDSQPLQEDNASCLVNIKEKEEKSELGHSSGRCADDQRNGGVLSAPLQGKRNKCSRQEGTLQSGIFNVVRPRSKRRRKGLRNETLAVQHTGCDRRKLSKESALKVVSDSHKHSKKMGLEHASAKSEKHKGQCIAHKVSEQFFEKNAQSDGKSGSVEHGGGKFMRQVIPHAFKADEEHIKIKDRVALTKLKHQGRDRHIKGADGECSRKRKDVRAKRAYPLKEKAKHRARGQRSDLIDMKRLEDGNEGERIDIDQGINDEPTNRLASEVEFYSHRADEDMYWSSIMGEHANGSPEHPEKIKLAVDCGEREQATSGRREEIFQRNKSVNYNYRKSGEELLHERESTHHMSGLHNAKTEKGSARRTEAGRRKGMSGDRTLLGQSRDGTNIRGSIKLTIGDHKRIKERQNQPGVPESFKSQTEDCPDSENQVKHLYDEEVASLQKTAMRKAEGSRGPGFNKKKKSFAHARSATVKRHRKKARMDLLKSTDLKNNTYSNLVNKRENAQGHEETSQQHGETNHQSANHLEMVLGGKLLDASNLRSEQAECLCGHGGIELENVREQENDSEARLCTAKESIYGVRSGSSQDEPKQRGRSKLERWTNQKATEEDVSDRVVVHDKKVAKKQKRRGKRRNPTHRRSQDTISTSGQLLIQVGSSVLQATNVIGKDINAANEMHYRTEENDDSFRNWHGKAKASNQDATISSLCVRVDEQQNVWQPLKMQQLDLAAKLERRKERFKLPMMEEKDMRRFASDNHQLLDEQEVKPERPARKRRWGSS